MRYFKYSCETCNQHYDVQQGMDDGVLACPSCGTVLVSLGQFYDDISVPVTKKPLRAEASLNVSPQQQVPKWFYSMNGGRLGPVTDTGIRLLLSRGDINNETLLWAEGLDEWIPLSQTFFNMTRRSSVPPPLNGEAVDNNFVWVLAFAPLLGTIIEYIVAATIGANASNLWFITIVLNIILCIFDEQKLKKAGHDTSKIQGWVIFLIPVYLFKRATALRQSLAYFYVWLAVFFFVIFIGAL